MSLIFTIVVMIPALLGFMATLLGMPILFPMVGAAGLAAVGVLGLLLASDTDGSGALGIFAFALMFLASAGSLALASFLGYVIA